MINKFQVGDLIYDADIYDGMNTDLGDLEFYKRWLPPNKSAKILELCCGTGRLTIPIAKEGYDVSAVDITPQMIERAREKANEEDVRIDFNLGDIRAINLEEKFDFVFIPFNSIHHLYTNEDLFNAITVVKRHLQPDGFFVFDCFNPNIRYIVKGETKEGEVGSFITVDGRQVVVRQEMKYDSKSQVNRILWKYFINGKFHSSQNLDMRMFFPQEIDTYLKWNGFEFLKKFGTFEEKEFESTSEKQIFVCRPFPTSTT